MEQRAILLFVLTALSWVDLASSVSCYYYDGSPIEDQQICPGSSQCCGVQATCTQNRLCDNPGEPNGNLVRGPCAVTPWNSTICSPLCLYDESTQGGRFPRVRRCADGSYCCNNDQACCEFNRGTFLDDVGNIVERSSSVSPSSTTPTPTPSSLLPTLSSSTTTSSPITTATPSNASDSLSKGAKIGIGVGVSVGVVAVIALAIIAWTVQKKRKQKSGTNPFGTPTVESPHELSTSYNQTYASGEMPVKDVYAQHTQFSHELADNDRAREMHELDATKPDSQLTK